MSLQFTPQQSAAIKQANQWFKDKNSPQIFRLFGYAGTGKTTLAKTVASELNCDVVYGAFTGKAAQVMRNKGCADAQTIHSMIYETRQDEHGKLHFKKKSQHNCEVAGAGLVIIDECSMVDENLANDLLSYGTKVLVIGDPAQLPPVKGTGFFTEAAPDAMLTEVHRQARENPIIALSMKIREGERLEKGDYGATRIIHNSDVDTDEVLAAEQVICGLNRTRVKYNKRLRELLGFPAEVPVAKDKLICLKNDRTLNVFNGSMWMLDAAKLKQKKNIPPYYELKISGIDEPALRSVNVRTEFFNGTDDKLEWNEKRGTQEFTFGYAITCHKSQGSQWKDVMIFDESFCFKEDARRWLYTAVTRAAERLTLVQWGKE